VQEALSGRDRRHGVDEPALLRFRQKHQRDAANHAADASAQTVRDQVGQRPGVAFQNGDPWQCRAQVLDQTGIDLHHREPFRRQPGIEERP